MIRRFSRWRLGNGVLWRVVAIIIGVNLGEWLAAHTVLGPEGRRKRRERMARFESGNVPIPDGLEVDPGPQVPPPPFVPLPPVPRPTGPAWDGKCLALGPGERSYPYCTLPAGHAPAVKHYNSYRDVSW